MYGILLKNGCIFGCTSLTRAYAKVKSNDVAIGVVRLSDRKEVYKK